jgi:hypothetical protein
LSRSLHLQHYATASRSNDAAPLPVISPALSRLRRSVHAERAQQRFASTCAGLTPPEQDIATSKRVLPRFGRELAASANSFKR